MFSSLLIKEKLLVKKTNLVNTVSKKVHSPIMLNILCVISTFTFCSRIGLLYYNHGSEFCPPSPNINMFSCHYLHIFPF